MSHVRFLMAKCVAPHISLSPSPNTRAIHGNPLLRRMVANRRDGWAEWPESAQLIRFHPQSYVLYSVSFILSAHMASAWNPFGDISDRLNSLSVLLSLSIVGISGVAIAYDVALRKHFDTISRQRRSGGFQPLITRGMSGGGTTSLSLAPCPRFCHLPRSGKGKLEEGGAVPGTGKGRGDGIDIRRTIQTRRKTDQGDERYVDRAESRSLNPRSALALAVRDRANPPIVPRTTTKSRLRR